MADNVTIPTQGTGDTTPVIATDDVSSVHFQKVKVDLGADGASSALVRGQLAKASCLPVTLASDEDTVNVDLGANNDVVVSGTDVEDAVAAANPVMVGGRFDSTPRTLDDGDAGAVALTAAGVVQVTDDGSALLVDGSAVTQPASLLGENTVDVAAGTDGGVVVLAVRDDVLTSLTPIDGDYVQVRTDASGSVWVAVSSVNPGVGSTDLGKSEDAVHGDGDTGVMSLAVRNDVLAALAGTDGDYAPVQVTAAGALWVEDAPNDVDSNNSTTTPLGISAVFTGTGTDILNYAAVTVQLFADEDSATDGMSFQFSTDGTNWDSTHVFTLDATMPARVFQFTTHAQFFRLVYTNGGTAQTAVRIQTLLHHTTPITTIHRAVDDVSPDRSCTLVKSVLIARKAGAGDFTPINSTTGGNLKTSIEEVNGSAEFPAKGTVAHDAVDADAPVKIGFIARTANPTAVAALDRVDGYADDVGRQVVVLNSPRDLEVHQTTDTTGTTETTILTAGAAGVFHDLTQLTITNASATATVVTLRDDTAGTAVGKYAIAANGGIVLSFPTPFKQALAADNWTAQSSATVNLHFVVQAVKNV